MSSESITWESDTGIWVEKSGSYRGDIFSVWIDGEEESICEGHYTDRKEAEDRAKHIDDKRPSRYSVIELAKTLDKFWSFTS